MQLIYLLVVLAILSALVLVGVLWFLNKPPIH